MSIKYTFSSTFQDPSGYFEIAPGTLWTFQTKPNKRTRWAARIFLGWRWYDN